MAHQDPFLQSPFNSVPPAVVALSGAIFVIEIVFWLGGRGVLFGAEAVGWRVEAIQDWALWPRLFAEQIANGTWAGAELLRFVTYPFLHFSFVGAVFATVMLLAIGNFVGRSFGNFAVVVIFFVASIVGGFVYCGLVPGSGPLFGAFPGVYGLIGAYSFLLWVGLGQLGENQYQAFSLIGFLLGIQLLFGLLFGTRPDWIADLAGFLVGFVIAPSLAPGGFRRLLNRLRQR